VFKSETQTCFINVYLAGDIDDIRRSCKDFCNQAGLCVTVTKTEFIYTGGAEVGAVIGFVNYPKFPSTEEEITAKALTLAEKLRKEAYQDSALIQGPSKTIWISNRK